MGHLPHLYVPGPWLEPTIEPARESVEHLDRVLRIRSGETVSYTDGAGSVGEGIWESPGLRRGPERTLSRPSPDLTMAVAAPRSAARQRFVVEKLAELGAKHITIRPHCPWQNGKVERFNRTLQTEWAYRQIFTTNQARHDALAPWLNNYNNHRRHSAIGGHPPISRVTPT